MFAVVKAYSLGRLEPWRQT